MWTSPRTRRYRSDGRAALLLVFLAAACSPQADRGGAAPEASAPTAGGSRVVLPSGRVIALEVARTEEEKAQGLMYRASMPSSAGMVFLFDEPAPQSFWMKNCHFPLDMVFTLRDGSVVDVLENVPPCAGEDCPTYPSRAKADTVVELVAGTAAKNGVKTGRKLVFKDVAGR